MHMYSAFATQNEQVWANSTLNIQGSQQSAKNEVHFLHNCTIKLTG